MGSYEEFFQVCNQTARSLLSKAYNLFPFLIFSHYDPDGLTAATILGTALAREKIPYQIQILKHLEYSALEKINRINQGEITVIFLDLGSGVIDGFSNWDEKKSVFIIDHHYLEENIQIPKHVELLNPHIYSIDGSSEISGSGIAYLIAKEMNPRNIDQAKLAIIGALGDYQDKGEKSSLLGLNKQIVNDAIKTNQINETEAVWFFDRSRSIKSVLWSSRLIEFNNEIELESFLEDSGIQLYDKDRERIFYDLSYDECKNIASKLIEYGVEQREIIKTDYRLLNEEIVELEDARVFATRLNACGRLDRADIGIALCSGDRSTALRELKQIIKEDRKIISENLQFAKSEGNITEKTALYVLDGRPKINEKFIGRITSMLSYQKEFKLKPILGIAKTSNERVKLSFRNNTNQNANFDLVSILKKVISNIEPNTEVGGHSDAAGAIVSENKIDEIIWEINETIMKVRNQND
ncbi:DHH family phosphoesterase [Candidatus Hodarchaeum mangrovi]